MQRPYELYRHFDAAGRLLYVGITCNMLTRLRQHKNTANWYDQIVRIEIERFPSKQQARTAERSAIAAERPLFNLWTEERKGPHSRRPEIERQRQALFAEMEKRNLHIDRRSCVSVLQEIISAADEGRQPNV